MTSMRRRLIALKLKSRNYARQRLVAKVSEPLMPKLGGGGVEGVVMTRPTSVERVEISSAITSENNRPSSKVLHRKPKRVKLNSNRIITS
jgi:hypothetical protein